MSITCSSSICHFFGAWNELQWLLEAVIASKRCHLRLSLQWLIVYLADLASRGAGLEKEDWPETSETGKWVLKGTANRAKVTTLLRDAASATAAPEALAQREPSSSDDDKPLGPSRKWEQTLCYQRCKFQCTCTRARNSLLPTSQGQKMSGPLKAFSTLVCAVQYHIRKLSQGLQYINANWWSFVHRRSAAPHTQAARNVASRGDGGKRRQGAGSQTRQRGGASLPLDQVLLEKLPICPLEGLSLGKATFMSDRTIVSFQHSSIGVHRLSCLDIIVTVFQAREE